ncbi:MAG: hypothetical protein BMS9Abin36_1188 [Gammaproteobacteria bacterium]|nr:MAG: hypothetical protein BMS9Abin36_1188 [Gammaproteobacteria bacterium]
MPPWWWAVISAPRIYIHATAAIGPHGDTCTSERKAVTSDEPKQDLKPLIKELVGQPLRQASHLVSLAVCGALLCRKQNNPPLDRTTGIYVATGLGELEKANALFYQVMPPRNGLASPFDFINAAINMAAFYCAKVLDLESRNLTFSHNEFSFEVALETAISDLRAGIIPAALVGGVDERSYPRSYHEERMPLNKDQFMGEGSGWLLLDTSPEGARGEILEVARFDRGDANNAIAELLKQHRMNPAQVTLLPGTGLNSDETETLMKVTGVTRKHEYINNCGVFYTAVSFGLTHFCEQKQAGVRYALHVNHDNSGSFIIVLASTSS